MFTFIDWELLFEKWPASWDAFKNHSKRLKTLLNKSSKCLETLWMNIECVLRRFRMISQSVSRRFGIYSKCLKTLWYLFESVSRRFRMIHSKASWDVSNKYQSVLRHFGKSFESVSRRIQYSFKVSQDAFEWFIRKRLETFRMNFECVLRRRSLFE